VSAAAARGCWPTRDLPVLGWLLATVLVTHTHPLRARVGERVRIWVLEAGPSRSTSFHVVGGQFDTTYAEGAWLLRRGDGGAQSLALGAAQGGFVEMSFREAGDYPFVSHVMVDAERGAHGTIRVIR